MVVFLYRPFFFGGETHHKLMYFVFLFLLVLHEGRVSPQVWLRGLRVEVFLQLQTSVNNERLYFGSGTKLTILGKMEFRYLIYLILV